MSDYMDNNVAKLSRELSYFDWSDDEPAFEISDDGDLVIHMDDDHTGWVVEEMADETAGYLSKETLRLMLEMLDNE